VTVRDLDPKAVSTQELYGYVNLATREWKVRVLLCCVWWGACAVCCVLLCAPKTRAAKKTRT
jgi:hypothetical protein